MNNTDEDRAVTVQFHPEALGLPALQQGYILDAWAGATFQYHHYDLNPQGQPRMLGKWVTQQGQEVRVPVEAGQLTVQVPQRGFRLLMTPPPGGTAAP